MQKKKVLIIDGNNNYFRAYIVDPSVSTNGQPIGGLKGFIKILQKLCRETNPNRVVICWDGKGGSAKRRAMNKNYKEGRKPIRLNRNIQNLSDNEEIDNKIWQMTRLAEYINEMPIVQLLLDSVEADDLISAVANHHTLQNYNKVIVSSDKDFIQLKNEKTSVWRPVEKKYYTPKEVNDRFGVPSHNFIHYKVFMGDGSDNIKGINGVGIKTLQAKLPLLLEDRTVTLEELLDYCKAKQQEHKIYRTIVDSEMSMRLNWQLMSLEDLDIASNFKLMIADMAKREIPKLDTFNFKRMFMLDKAYTAIPNVDTWLANSFNTLAAFSQQ